MGVLAAYMVPHPLLILPEVGGGEEKGIQDTINAYEEAACRIAALKPETIVLLSPHQVMYGDYFHISPGKGARGISASSGRRRLERIRLMNYRLYGRTAMTLLPLIDAMNIDLKGFTEARCRSAWESAAGPGGFKSRRPEGGSG